MHPSALAFFTSDNSSNFSPGAIGGVVAVVICGQRARQEIGGWLMYYFWQLFGGVITTVLFFVLSFSAYVPEAARTPHEYHLFLLTALPSILLFFAELILGTMLLAVRSWDLLKLLRTLMLVQIAVGLFGAAIDVRLYRSNLVFDALSVITGTFWSLYFFRSRRVQSVFKRHDWPLVVDTVVKGGMFQPARPRS